MNAIIEAALNIVFESDDEEENLERVPRPRFIRDRLEHFTDMDDKDFIRRFRFTKRGCLHVLELIEERLEYPSDKNYAVSPINQLLLCMRYYATGYTQICASDFNALSEATAHRIIHRVTRAIASLYRQFVYLPRTEQESLETQAGFYSIARFPRVIGAMDCTHVKIRSPGGQYAEYYRNRKSYFSLNVQAICNSKLEFSDVVARWPGSVFDQTIFDSCRQRAKFEANDYRNTFLLGDGAYACRTYLMPPMDNPVEPEEILYNESQIRTRNPVERIFGVWKRRFPVLALGINVSLENCMPIIIATAVLFNILRRANDPQPGDDPALRLPAPWEALIERGQIMRPYVEHNRNGRRLTDLPRRQLINDYFKTLVELHP
ncbi:putative nuclease HARBI1 [Thrips palmi]|uniref:Putative nuclease HARBI1 n=1 Tax=Thrips palmi TaxID=161013 RepID=A0A6P8YQS7_THRPL|nr:putative nuclease HARBI1 [Thrips palmi]